MVQLGTADPDAMAIASRALFSAEELRAKSLRRLDFIGDHVATTTSWIVDRILADDRQGHDITWLTPARLLRRGLGRLFGAKRDLLARYKLDERSGAS